MIISSFFSAALRCTALCALAVGLAATTAHAATSEVHVSLLDSSVDAKMQGMMLRSDHASVKAGKVKFAVRNESTSAVHEMIVVKVDRTSEQLPYNATDNTVEEDKIRHVGEVSELQPGAKGEVTLNLKPGIYMLMCNQPGHYHAGMVTALTVTE